MHEAWSLRCARHNGLAAVMHAVWLAAGTSVYTTAGGKLITVELGQSGLLDFVYGQPVDLPAL
jgi:hypothetical protein